ncbi:MAG TPA: hypothetical protein VER98_15205, partial [Terriglobia bacterium]|nr:hypothetical protein [Terriglobia bacterium]
MTIRFTPQQPRQPAGFAIVPTPAPRLTTQGADRDIANSPDGSHIVYRVSSAGQPQLVVRALDQS